MSTVEGEIRAGRLVNALHIGRFDQALFYGHGMPDARLLVYARIDTCETAERPFATTVKKGS